MKSSAGEEWDITRGYQTKPLSPSPTPEEEEEEEEEEELKEEEGTPLETTTTKIPSPEMIFNQIFWSIHFFWLISWMAAVVLVVSWSSFDFELGRSICLEWTDGISFDSIEIDETGRVIHGLLSQFEAISIFFSVSYLKKSRGKMYKEKKKTKF